jgi:hypothetical protein
VSVVGCQEAGKSEEPKFTGSNFGRFRSDPALWANQLSVTDTDNRHWQLLVPGDGAIVAWHEVPGTRPSLMSRPVGYGLIYAGVHANSMIGVTSGISCARSYRTLRDGSFEGRFPRHFVPGYDRCRPSGTRCGHFGTAFS